MKWHFIPGWFSRVNASVYLLTVYRPRWTTCLLGAVLLIVLSFCVFLGWCVVQSERRLAEEEWDAIQAMEVIRGHSSPANAKPPDRASSGP
jgi:hypothetical protein